MAKTYTGGNRPSLIRLSFDYSDYYPTKLQTLPERELRAEYSRLRSIANKRIARIEASEYRYSDVARYNAGKYIPLAAIDNKRELTHLLTDVVNFLTAKTSTVSGLHEQRRLALETLKQHDVNFITEDNYNAFGEFMGWARSFLGDSAFDSKRVQAMYDWAEKTNASSGSIKRNFETYLANFDKPHYKPRTRSRQAFDADQFAEAFKVRKGR